MGRQKGSREGEAALTALAAALDITTDALARALTDAFDISRSIPNSCIALQIALGRLGFNFHAKVLDRIVSAFGQGFGGFLNGPPREYTRWIHLI
jgi:hypothetical protein